MGLPASRTLGHTLIDESPDSIQLHARHDRTNVNSLVERLADPREVRAAFRDYLDGLMLAARSGFDGVVFTEHAQASYDMSANPSLAASALAYAFDLTGETT